MQVITDLKKLYSSDESFKSPAQSHSVAAVCQGANNLMINLPTGADKSMCIFIPAITSLDRIMIVVTPLVALQTDNSAKATQFKISHCIWNNRMTCQNTPKLVLVLVENADLSTFTEFVNNLNSMKHLNHLIIDKLHLVIRSDHCEAMQSLCAMCLIDAFIVLMMATLTPLLEMKLSKFFGHVFTKIQGCMMCYNQYLAQLLSVPECGSKKKKKNAVRKTSCAAQGQASIGNLYL